MSNIDRKRQLLNDIQIVSDRVAHQIYNVLNIALTVVFYTNTPKLPTRTK